MTDKLTSFWKELNGREKSFTEQQWFSSIANRLMNDLSLIVGKNSYRITECEFYYSDIDHPDPYIYGVSQQMTTGQLYLNRTGGLDITFGNDAYPAFGGILIRGIRNLNTNQYINKVTEIAAEVFVALGNIVIERNCIYLAELEPESVKIEEPIQTTRVRLTRQEPDKENFYEKPYRYIVELVPAHKFNDRFRIVKSLLAENKISAEHAKYILNYNLKQQ